jgi:general secretion pathway protein H
VAESLAESRDRCRIAFRGVRNRPFPTSWSRILNSAAGFTLVELIVVLVIVALSIAVVVPRVGSNWQKIEDSAFLQEFTKTIKRARLFAMNCGHPVAFRLNGTARVYGFENPPRNPIPLNTEVRSENLQKEQETGDFLIVFHPDGSLVGNDFEVIFDGERTYHISIHPLFGTVSLQRMSR